MAKSKKSKRETQETVSGICFPIVGVGASAGGLDAIKRLLENLPQGAGLAVVVVQHLAGGQESMLSEILSRSTKMPVLKVESGVEVLVNHVYVIPSGKAMILENGRLWLKPKGISVRPIDGFLRSLAVGCRNFAVGVVLSGTGTDGTEGLGAIKAEGGVTFAQDPRSAQYADMPKFAIEADVADFVFSPEKIAQELVRFAIHPEVFRLEGADSDSQVGDQESLGVVFGLLQASFGVNFEGYKKSTISMRISRRMVLSKIKGTKKYVAYLRAHPDELQLLFDDLLIGVTGFFRDPETFVMLKEQVFSNLTKKSLPSQPLRVWIPGCSTGEEVYSLAISIAEFFEEKNVEVPIQVFGTDVNQKNIETSRRGIYLKSIEDKVSEARLKRFFTSINGNYQVTKKVRDICVFAKHDLTQDPPFSNLDLIVFRNLFIYFDAPLQEKIMTMFYYGLKSSGILVLGKSEDVGKFTFLFEPLTTKGELFSKKLAQPKTDLQLASSTPLRESVSLPKKLDPMAVLREQVDHLLMDECVPASLVLNANLDILVFRGKVNPYISVESGDASLNVSRIARKELRPALQTAVYKARKTGKDIQETVRLTAGKQTRTIHIHVKPLRTLRNEEPYYLVQFDETTARGSLPEKSIGVSGGEGVKDVQIRELSEDLESTKQTLQTVVEQQEATNEELRSSMEELQSSNEELMSMNEEIETAKEELQSTNEELTTLNDELRNRNVSLNVLNDDLANLMENVDTAVVIVDNEFRIRRFTNSAMELLRLLPSDVGHLIVDIRMGIPIEDLEGLLVRVLALETVRLEMQTGKGRWYQMRIRPYLTQDKKIGGAVLSFAEVTEIKKLEGEKKYYTENLEQQVKDQSDKLLASETLAAIGKTAGMVGHDIRNPLQSIVAELYLAKQELEPLADIEAKRNLKQGISAIEDELVYINKIVADLQDYAKPAIPQLQEVDMEKTLKQILPLIIIPNNVQVSISIENGFPKLKLDPTYMKRIFTNLILNSIQAMPNGGKLEVNAACQYGKAAIVIVDTGEGIADAVKGKIFTPLFTTKPKGQGFGLAAVKRLAETMGGAVSFESEKGKGAKFILEFPVPR